MHSALPGQEAVVENGCFTWSAQHQLGLYHALQWNDRVGKGNVGRSEQVAREIQCRMWGGGHGFQVPKIKMAIVRFKWIISHFLWNSTSLRYWICKRSHNWHLRSPPFQGIDAAQIDWLFATQRTESTRWLAYSGFLRQSNDACVWNCSEPFSTHGYHVDVFGELFTANIVGNIRLQAEITNEPFFVLTGQRNGAREDEESDIWNRRG